MPLQLSDTPPEPLTALEHGLAALWRDTAAGRDGAGRARLRTALIELFDGWERVLENEVRRRMPDPVDYLELRRVTSGGRLFCALDALYSPEIATKPQISEISDSSIVRQLQYSAHDYAALVNDLYSYQREIEYDVELHNLVYLTQSFLGCSREVAADIVVDLANERSRQFELVARERPPEFFADHALPGEVRTALLGHVDRLRNHMAGNLHWHTVTGRYCEQALRASRPKPVITGPLGPFVSVLADGRAGADRNDAESLIESR
ncbi:terpene synthase family protein [Nocardia niigatensis]